MISIFEYLTPVPPDSYRDFSHKWEGAFNPFPLGGNRNGVLIKNKINSK
jgi:hypothetical protein